MCIKVPPLGFALMRRLSTSRLPRMDRRRSKKIRFLSRLPWTEYERIVCRSLCLSTENGAFDTGIIESVHWVVTSIVQEEGCLGPISLHSHRRPKVLSILHAFNESRSRPRLKISGRGFGTKANHLMFNDPHLSKVQSPQVALHHPCKFQYSSMPQTKSRPKTDSLGSSLVRRMQMTCDFKTCCSSRHFIQRYQWIQI